MRMASVRSIGLPPISPPPQTTPGEDSQQEQSPRTLADLFAGRVGRIRSGGKERLSEECGAAFTDYLEEKRRAGHL